MNTEMLENIRAVKSGEKTITGIVKERLGLLIKENPRVNAVVEYHPDELIRQAKELDNMVLQGKSGCLAGAVITVKDNLDVQGMKSTAGLMKLKDNIAGSDCGVVSKLRAEGAIILGKTNMPPAAMDVQTDNPVYGRTNHPDFTNRTCGGSSGGGSCAVKLGFSDIDIGNDLLGSIRIPAHFCGVYGFIPTEGAIQIGELAGINKMGSTLSKILRIGIQSREFENIEYVLPVIKEKGFPVCDSTQPKRLRIAWSDNCGGLPLSKESKHCIMHFLDKLSEQHDLYEILPSDYDFNAARECFIKLLYGTVAASLPPAACFISKHIFRQKFMNNKLKDYLFAENIRETLKNQLHDLLQQYDCLVVPVSATNAFAHKKPERMMGIQPIYTTFEADGIKAKYATANMGYTTPFMTGTPIISMPVGYTTEKLPTGVQVICDHFQEYKLMNIVRIFKQITNTL